MKRQLNACKAKGIGGGFKLKEGRFMFDFRKRLFTVRAVSYWYR